MAYTANTTRIGIVDLLEKTTIVPGIANLPSSVMESQLFEVVTGWDSVLGGGEFIYMKGAASLAAGDVVTYGGLTGATTFRWDGTSNTGYPIAVALSNPTATQYGWFQISGNAIVNCGGTVVAGDKAYFNATASVKTAVVAGKQVLGITASTANGATIAGLGTLPATQAVYLINRPYVQGQIT